MISAAVSYAQTAYDALLFSENNYEGTARSVAMGNAFTALGGDLGSISINPAGSAVAGYSQFTITPGLTFSTSSAQGVSPYENGSLPYFERKMRSSMTEFNLPNIGITINWETNRTSGLKNLTFGFVANKAASFDQDVYANGMLAAYAYVYLAKSLKPNKAVSLLCTLAFVFILFQIIHDIAVFVTDIVVYIFAVLNLRKLHYVAVFVETSAVAVVV